MYKEHEFCNPPSSDAILWRYMDYTKFVSLLEQQALFFARADKLGDTFEGALSSANREFTTLRADLGLGVLLKSRILQRNMRRYILISCWHESPHESAAMWTLYSSETEGIAIKTDFDSFKKSLTTSQDIWVGTVSYTDYDSYLMPEGNFVYPFLHKRHNFEHEREVRAIALVYPSKDGYLDLSQEICDIGKFFEVDLSLLIQEVIVAPKADDRFFECIKSVTARYNLEAPVSKSKLADPPTWG